MLNRSIQGRKKMETMGKLLFLVIVGCFLVIPSDCEENEKYKILAVFPHPGISHFAVFSPLLEELAHRGHEVTVLSHFPQKEKLQNYRDISLLDSSGILVDCVDLKNLDHSMLRLKTELQMLWRMANITCAPMYDKPEVKKLINSSETFDLVLTEMFNTDCVLGFVHKFKAPYIAISTHEIIPWGNHRLENPDNPSYIPNIFSKAFPNMNFFERVTNTIFTIVCQITWETIFNAHGQEQVEKAFGPGVPPLREIAKNVSALLVNTHFSIHGSRPHSVGVVEVGGLHMRPLKPLPKKIKDFLDSANDGVLYFNWGSLVKTSSVPKDKLGALIKVLGELKQKVIWKWEDKELPNKPKNLLVRNWLPQFEILSHPNVKGFLGHGGLLGLSEAVYAGVPMVVVPMFGDQYHNGAALAARGAGILLEFNEITEESLGHALNEILNNPSYRKNAQAVSEAYRDRPASALETAVWWVEYIARGKGQPFLKSASANLTWYQYHLLDVIAFLLVVTLAVLYAAFSLLKLLLRVVTGKKTGPKRGSVNGVGKDGIHKKKA